MKPAKRLAHRVVAGRVFVVDGRSSTLHSLSETATSIWKGLCAGEDAEGIADRLAAEFDVTRADALRDVKAFLERLRGMDLVADDG